MKTAGRVTWTIYTNELTKIQNILFIFNMDVDVTSVSKPNGSSCSECHEEVNRPEKIHNQCLMKNVGSSDKFQTTQSDGLQAESHKSIIIFNGLPRDMTEQKLVNLLSEHGVIQDTYFKKNFSDQFACISFRSEEDALRVYHQVQLQMTEFFQRQVMTSFISENTTPIDILPDDCLRLIFRKVNDMSEKLALEEVCKRWKDVARQSWGNVTKFRNSYRFDSKPGIVSLIMHRCGTYLTSLHLNFDYNAKSVLQLVVQRCDNLDSIRFWFRKACMLTDNCLPIVKQIILKSSKLRRFQLSYLHDDSDFDCFKALPSNIKEMSFFAKPYTTQDFLSTTVDLSRFNDLVALELIKFRLGKHSLLGIEGLVNLEYLSLMGSITHPSNIEKITHFTKLKHLEIPTCELDDVTLSRIVHNNQMLTHLDISDNTSITNQSFQYVTQLPHLKNLVMNNVPCVTGHHLTKMRSLETLNCNDCDLIRDIDLIMIVISCPDLCYLEADGPATMRFLTQAKEIIQSRKGIPISIHVDRGLYWQWKKVDDDRMWIDLLYHRDSEDFSPSDRCDWYLRN